MTDEELMEIMKERFYNREGFIKYNGYKFLEGKQDYCVLTTDITKNSLNPYDMAHGGFLFGLADTAAGCAASSTGRAAVTVNSSIEYLKGAKGSSLKAVASAIKTGKTISVYEVNIYDDKEQLVAKATFTYYYINDKN